MFWGLWLVARGLRQKKKETSEEPIVIIHVSNVNGLESSVSGKDDELSDSGHL